MAKGGITAGVTMHTMLTHLATDDHDGYHWSRCHTPLGHILQVFYGQGLLTTRVI